MNVAPGRGRRRTATNCVTPAASGNAMPTSSRPSESRWSTKNESTGPAALVPLLPSTSRPSAAVRICREPDVGLDRNTHTSSSSPPSGRPTNHTSSEQPGPEHWSYSAMATRCAGVTSQPSRPGTAWSITSGTAVSCGRRLPDGTAESVSTPVRTPPTEESPITATSTARSPLRLPTATSTARVIREKGTVSPARSTLRCGRPTRKRATFPHHQQVLAHHV